MDKSILTLSSIVVKMIIHLWSDNKESAIENIVEIFETIGIDALTASKAKTSFSMFENRIAEELIGLMSYSSLEESRKEVLIDFLIEALHSINIDETLVLEDKITSDELKLKILQKTKHERQFWSTQENELYEHYAGYVAKCIIQFVESLPSFTPEALKLLIKQQEDYGNKLDEVLYEIKSVAEALESSEKKYRDFEESYREYIAEHYRKVELFGAGINDRRIRKYDITNAYVELNGCDEEDEDAGEIDVDTLFETNNIVWIKGEAGAGKTTFLQWIALCTARNQYDIVSGVKNRIPVVIELRKTIWPINYNNVLLQCAAAIGRSCPDGWGEYLLENNRAIFLIDGLDEVEERRREETYEFVEDIVRRYPQVKILLTARNSVYEELECLYKRVVINPMKMDKIKEFVQYWHKAVLGDTGVEDQGRIEVLKANLLSRIIENPPLKNLARNPLLCAMICALNYVSDEHLPNSKMELYDKCCDMLIDARDSVRDIRVGKVRILAQLTAVKKRRIIEEIAYWMLRNGYAAAQYEELTLFLTSLLPNMNFFKGEEEWKDIAEQLLKYLTERSGIIRSPEMGVIDFIHKTFLEYLSVKAICRNCDFGILAKEACNVNWKETIIMCFAELGSKQVADVLDRMIEYGETKKDERYFLMASLGAANAVYTKPETKRSIDSQIKKMIPPKRHNIPELSQAGEYLLPFLYNKEQYSDRERENCLLLLGYMNDIEESIPILLSYVSCKYSPNITGEALELLSYYSKEILEEYDVKLQLISRILEDNPNDNLIIHKFYFDILSNWDLSDYENSLMEEITHLHVIYNEDNDYSECSNKLYSACSNLESLIVEGEVFSFDFLAYFDQLKCFSFVGVDARSTLFSSLHRFWCMRELKELHISSNKIGSIYESDFNGMRKLEVIEINCMERELELRFEDFSKLPSLKQLILNVDSEVYAEFCYYYRNVANQKNIII